MLYQTFTLSRWHADIVCLNVFRNFDIKQKISGKQITSMRYLARTGRYSQSALRKAID